MKYKLERVEYLKGLFNKEISTFGKNDIQTEVNGDIKIGTMNDKETETPVNLVIKVELNVIATIEETREKIAEMTTTHILYYAVSKKEMLLEINSNGYTDKYKEELFDMLNLGYNSVREYILNTFAKSQINISLPYTIMEQ